MRKERSRIIGTLIIAGLALAAGYYLGMERAGSSAPIPGELSPADTAAAEPEILYWVAPMDPNFRRDEPGKSPMGMDLVPVYADEGGVDDGVSIKPSLQNSLGVRTEAAQVRPLWRRIDATGYVSFDETQISDINLRTEGWIERLVVNSEGERLKKGDLLFELYSPEVVNAQKEFLQSFQRGNATLVSGTENKLRALGMIEEDIEILKQTRQEIEHIRVVAPRDGIVTDLLVREGMHVQPHSRILRLADLSTVWLQAEIFESQAPWVAEGQAAEAWLDYLPGSVFAGEVEYVYPVLDPTTRNLKVRLRFENPGEKLKPNMYASVSIFGKLRPQALTIPREALIRGSKRDRVVVSSGDGTFQVHEVLAGMESSEWIEIVAGISEGDEVVTSAQFLIDSEASLGGSIVRLEDVPEDHEDAAPVTAFGSGWIEEIHAADARMRVSHGPIDALGWPAMNMEFETAPGVELDRLQVGQDIRFSLEQVESGRFIVTAISLRDADDETVTREILQEQGDD